MNRYSTHLYINTTKAHYSYFDTIHDQLRSYQTALETMDTSCKEQDEDAGRSLKGTYA